MAGGYVWRVAGSSECGRVGAGRARGARAARVTAEARLGLAGPRRRAAHRLMYYLSWIKNYIRS